jgi:hypothetical protein
MFPIGSTLPHDTATLHAGLAHGLAPLGLGGDAVKIEGDFPQLAAIRINLTNARFHRGLDFARGAGGAQSLCFARSVEIQGSPAQVESVPVELKLQAQDVVIGAADAAEGSGKVLVFERAAHGTLDLSVARRDLEKVMLEAGSAAAKEKGAEVQSVELQLQSEAPRALAVRALVTAKAMFFTTTVTISGCLEIDDRLNARLRDLHCEGDGMIGKMAAGALRSQFQKLENRSIPLGQVVGGMSLREVRLEGGDQLRVHAIFGVA